VFLLQEKDVDAAANEKYLFADFRLRKQHFSQPEGHETTRVSNPFSATWAAWVNKNANTRATRVIHTLVTADPMQFPQSVKNLACTATTKKGSETVGLLQDEACIDLRHMGRWCPTVAFDALSALKVRAAMRDVLSGGKRAKKSGRK